MATIEKRVKRTIPPVINAAFNWIASSFDLFTKLIIPELIVLKTFTIVSSPEIPNFKNNAFEAFAKISSWPPIDLVISKNALSVSLEVFPTALIIVSKSLN